jgi:methylmalonyl-CoA mutase C-terminal domain/subunit
LRRPDIAMTGKTARILMAKVGLDGHDRGVKVVARALRDAGLEVIYTGLHRTPEEVVVAAVQEDVDLIGLSILSGAHMTLVPTLLEHLRANDAGDIKVVIGGVIPIADRQKLRDLGAAAVFDQDAATDEIVDWIRREVCGPDPAAPVEGSGASRGPR